MIRIISVFTSLTFILFLAILLIVYAFLPDPVGILFYKDGNTVYEITRNTFFYTSLGLFFLLQLAFYLFRIYVLNRGLYRLDKRDLATWFRGMFLCVNIFFILLVIYIGLANNAINYSYSSIINLAFIGPFILLGWLMLLPVFYLSSIQKNKS